MKRACVIGWPIEHSRSPLIHTYWLQRYAIEGSYEKVAVKTEAAEGFLTSLAEHGFVGCNITVPHKETAFAVADEREASAEAVGAANTAWLHEGRLHVANTDTYGFMTSLSRSAPEWHRRDSPALVLGAGGAARAIMHGLLEAGVGEVRVCNRTRDRAEVLAQRFGPRVTVRDWAQRDTAAQDAGVLVNTTTIGMKGHGTLGLDLARLDPDGVVCDLVYVPLETELLAAARARGLVVVDGLGMLLHQAVPGFERWFGVRPEVTDELRQIVVADIEGR
jgi:shikimate dehydrogenase